MQYETGIAVGTVVRDTPHHGLTEPDDLGQVAEHVHQGFDGGDEQA